MRWELVLASLPFCLVGIRVVPTVLWTIRLLRTPKASRTESPANGCASGCFCLFFLMVGIVLLAIAGLDLFSPSARHDHRAMQ